MTVVQPFAKLTRDVEELKLARIKYRQHTVVAVHVGTSTYDADVEGVGRVNGFSAPPHFLPKVGDVFNLPLQGSVPGFEPNRIAPGAIGEEELAPYVAENITIALSAANGKNTFFYSPDAPTGLTPGNSVGDSWMRRDNTTRVITGTWEWDGDSWEPITYGDQVLASLTVGKLVGGTGTFDLIVGGRIATANTGQRTELNPLGLQAFNTAGTLTLNLDGVNNLMTGRYLTALTGRRIEIGASGQTGNVIFTSPTGTVARVQAFTASLPAAGTEALSMSVPITGAYGAWNSLQIQSNEQAYLLTGTMNVNYGGGTGGAFVISHATNKGTSTTAPALNARLRIDEVNGTRIWDDGNRLRVAISNDGGFQVWDGDDSGNVGDKRIVVENESTTIFNPAGPNSAFNGQGQIEVQRTQTIIRGNPNASGDDAYVNVISSGVPGSSARMGFWNRAGEGGMLKFYNLAGDAGGQRLEVRNGFDTVFIPIWATSFIVNSDRSTKANIAALPIDATEQMAMLKPRRYTRKGDGVMPDVEQLGFVTDEMPADLVVGDPSSGNATGIDVMALLATVVGAAQNINERLTALEKGPTK